MSTLGWFHSLFSLKLWCPSREWTGGVAVSFSTQGVHGSKEFENCPHEEASGDASTIIKCDIPSWSNEDKGVVRSWLLVRSPLGAPASRTAAPSLPEQSMGITALQLPPAWRAVAVAVAGNVGIFTFLTAFYSWSPLMAASDGTNVMQPLRIERGGGELREVEEKQKILFLFF